MVSLANISAFIPPTVSQFVLPKMSEAILNYGNVPKFSDRHVWANSADPEQTDQGLHCLQFPLHLLDALL